MVKLNTFMFDPNANKDPDLNSSKVVLELGKRDPTGSLSSTSFIFQKGREDSSSINSHEQRATDAVHKIIQQFDEGTNTSDSDSSSLATFDTTETGASSEDTPILQRGEDRLGPNDARQALETFLQRQEVNDMETCESDDSESESYASDLSNLVYQNTGDPQYSETSDRTSDLNSVSSGLTDISQNLARVSGDLARVSGDLSSITSELSEISTDSTDSTDSSDLTESTDSSYLTDSTEETDDTMMGFAKYLDNLKPSEIEAPSDSDETYDVSPEELARLQDFVKVLHPRVMETQKYSPASSDSTESTEETNDTMMGFAKYLDNITPSEMENPSESGETYNVSPEELARLREFVKVLQPRVMETHARAIEMRGGRATSKKEEKDVPRDFIIASSTLPQEMEQQSLHTSTLPMQGGAIRAGSDVVFGTCADSVETNLPEHVPTKAISLSSHSLPTRVHSSQGILNPDHSPLVHYGGATRPFSDETSSFSSYITDATNSVLNDYTFTEGD